MAIGLLLLLTGWSSCKKFVEVDAPTTNVNEENVYKTDATAIAVLTSLYSQMSGNNSRFSGNTSISLVAGLSADELTLAGVVTDERLLAYYRNKLRTNANENYGTELWGGSGSGLFFYLFVCNAAIEGLNKSTSLTPSVKNQLLGEAKFMRAFFHFYLAGFYGDVPIILTTNAAANAVVARSPKQDVYKQIAADLKDAQSLLNSSFLDATLLRSTSERVRPTQWAATALLARTYLYMNEYANAEAEATKIINNTGLFSLSSLNDVFLKNSTEAIWQLQPVQTGRNTEDAMIFVLSSTGPNANVNPVYLSPQQLNAFEFNDKRKINGNWIQSVTAGSTTYYYPYKYKQTTGTVSEYLMVFRLAEQYLIRAEARAQLNNLGASQNDLNMIRSRAGLGNTNANDQASLLTAILHERQVELFSELGQRWLDLKRSGTINNVMNIVTPLKGGVWNTNWQLYPIPWGDIQQNPNLAQNNGY